jgi:hypothetical protein
MSCHLNAGASAPACVVSVTVCRYPVTAGCNPGEVHYPQLDKLADVPRALDIAGDDESRSVQWHIVLGIGDEDGCRGKLGRDFAPRDGNAVAVGAGREDGELGSAAATISVSAAPT